ncbi:hypothetical protein SAMN05216420_10656 [Nitrosospira sp. Nl5]|nr:hypothetical protein SAMN05216420_10656 [Nitrosospira sp. Nl5]
MCVQVYGVVFEDPKPKINGRRGQAQGGVDVFVNAKSIGRIGVQCKKYFKIELEFKHVDDEVKKADKYKTPIKILIIATTSPSSAPLLHQVQVMSDAREAQGLFTVEVEFWEDIENRINSFNALLDSYAPHSAGAAYHRLEQKLDSVLPRPDSIPLPAIQYMPRPKALRSYQPGELTQLINLFRHNSTARMTC